MRGHFQATFLLTASLLLALPALAEEPATPKSALLSWSEFAASWTVDRAAAIYYARTEKEAAFARILAEDAVLGSKLQKAARDKWGKDAATAVARATFDDTIDDDLAAAEKVDGNHATITFKTDTQIPVVNLVKVEGEWKVDMAALVRSLGDDAVAAPAKAEKFVKTMQTALRDMQANKYKTADELSGFLRTEFVKVLVR